MTTSSTSAGQQTQRGRTSPSSSRDSRTLQGNLIVLCLRLARLEGYIGTLRQARKSGPLYPTLRRLGLLRRKVQQFSCSASFQKRQIVPFNVFILTLPTIGTVLLQWSEWSSISSRPTLRTLRPRAQYDKIHSS